MVSLRTEKNYKHNQKTSNKMAISTYVSIFILNVNELNAPIKDIGWPGQLDIRTRPIYLLPIRDTLQS